MVKEYSIEKFDIKEKNFTTLEYAARTKKTVTTDNVADEIDKFVTGDTALVKVFITRQYAEELKV